MADKEIDTEDLQALAEIGTAPALEAAERERNAPVFNATEVLRGTNKADQ